MIKKCALWLRDSFIRNRSLNATRIVAGSFAAIILIGALLLTLPIASRDGQSAGFFTGLFTATMFVNPTVGIGVCLEATLVMILAGTLAGLVPARKAARIRPIEALRSE